MTGVILAGGLGTRLRSVLPDTAKTLAPVEGRPFLYFLIEQLRRAGIAPVILCTGHLAGQIRELSEGLDRTSILYSQENRPEGTAGALRLAWRNYPQTAPWIVMNGDSYAGIDLGAMMEHHRKSGLAATIGSVRVEDGRRFGSLEYSPDCRVSAFREKSPDPGARWINCGIYILTAPFLEALPDRSPLSLETEVFPSWIPRGINVFATEGRFIDIGTPESYSLAQSFFSEST